jgi:hypothetical protein
MSDCRTSPLARRSKPVRLSMTPEYEQHPQSSQGRSLLAAGNPGEVPLTDAGQSSRSTACVASLMRVAEQDIRQLTDVRRSSPGDSSTGGPFPNRPVTVSSGL